MEGRGYGIKGARRLAAQRLFYEGESAGSGGAQQGDKLGVDVDLQVALGYKQGL